MTTKLTTLIALVAVSNFLFSSIGFSSTKFNSDDATIYANSRITQSAPTAQSAYPDGIPHAIPGKIESVHFDNGGAGIAYNDTDAENNGVGPRQDEQVDTEYRIASGNLGWIVQGEWLEYTVNVSHTDTYTIRVKVSSVNNTGKFHIRFKGDNLTGDKIVESTGDWDNFGTITIPNIPLTKGEQVMRIYMKGGGFNMGSLTFTADNPVLNVTGVALNRSNLSLDVNETKKLLAIVSPENASNKDVTWKSDDESIATVDDEGLVTAVSSGVTFVTVTTVDGGIEDRCIINITGDGPVVTFDFPTGDTSVMEGYNKLYVRASVESENVIENVKLYVNEELIRTEQSEDFDWGKPGSGHEGELDIFTEGVYTFKAVALDELGKTGQKSFVLTVKATQEPCEYAVPRTAPLPTINKDYAFVHVLGSGPDLSNVGNFTINWNLEEENLNQLSINTTNGKPSWWNELTESQSNSFKTSESSIQLIKTGFNPEDAVHLDGEYYATIDGENFVLVQKSRDYTLVFSNSNMDPCASTSSSKDVINELTKESIRVYPMPFADNFTIEFKKALHVNDIRIYNTVGQLLQQKTINGITQKVNLDILSREALYFLRIETEDTVVIKKLIKN